MTKGGSIERETKLDVPDGFAVPELDHVLDGVLAVPAPAQSLRAVYYDTPDLRLARAGISVRFRTGEETRRGAGRWTVKLPEGERGAVLARREIDVRAPGRTVPDEVAGLVRGHVRSAPLAPVATLQTERHRIVLTSADGSALAELADDRVDVLEGRTVARRFREVEVELRDGAPPALLPAVAARLRKAGAAKPGGTSKLVRALGPRAQEPPDARPAALDPDEATVRDVVAAAIAEGVTRLLRHDPGVRLGGDPEDVHQARVAARRLRSDLRTFRDVVDDEAAAGLRDELRWLGGVLGAVRDADVLDERLRAQAAGLSAVDAEGAAVLLGRLAVEREAATTAARQAMDGDRYLALVDRLVASSMEPPVVADAGVRARKHLPAYVKGPWKHLQRAVEALDADPPDEALHEVRIRTKRLRYAAEAVAPVVGRRATRLAKAAAALQTVLGDFQDAVVAEDWLRFAAADLAGPPALVAGQLVAEQRRARRDARAGWPAAWDDLSAKKLRAWL